MIEEPAPPAPAPDPPPARAHVEGGTLHTWATGMSVVAACADLLAAVLLGLVEPASGDALRFDVRDLALCAGGAALAGFAVAAAGWWAGARGLVAGGLVHLALAAAAWFLAGPALRGLPLPAFAALIVHAVAGATAFAGAASARGAAPCPAGPARAAAENVESVLVAIAFALVIRHFAVEAYKIPTESMAPTLLGEQNGQGRGDRVLVAKWPVLFGGPDRWEIWVFRPPEERTINYVKRVGGLPGETISIEDGDLYADGAVCRKPEGTREAMWFPVWPTVASEKIPPWSGEGFRKEGADGFSVASATGRRLLEFGRQVRDGVSGLSGANPVGDVRLAFRVEKAEPGTELIVRITGRAGPCEVVLAADGTAVSWDCNGRKGRVAGPGGVAVETVEVSFSDLLFEVRTRGGGEALVRQEVDPVRPAPRKDFGVSFGVEKGGAAFRDVRLDRDVYYTDTPGGASFTVPAGHYFFLGDNSFNSEDSRKWTTWEVRETGGAGRVFLTEKRRRPAFGSDGRIGFRDRDGIVRSFAPSEARVSDGSVPCSFVPAADLHGRAFAIFWPPRWFTRVPDGRVGLLP